MVFGQTAGGLRKLHRKWTWCLGKLEGDGGSYTGSGCGVWANWRGMKKITQEVGGVLGQTGGGMEEVIQDVGVMLGLTLFCVKRGGRGGKCHKRCARQRIVSAFFASVPVPKIHW